MPNRRSFLKNTILTSTGLLIMPLLSFDEKVLDHQTGDDLEKGFFSPPHSAKPLAFWMWMNGHITQKGITLDLEQMKEMGLAGAFIFNTGTGFPQGPVVYGSAQWTSLVAHAMREAQSLGLDLFLHNSPGFSSTGGAKVPPETGMQQVVWTETIVESKGSVDLLLPQPLTKLGYYRDVAVIAYPALEAEKNAAQNSVVQLTVDGNPADKNLLLDESRQTAVVLNPSEGAKAVLTWEYSAPFEARSITITRLPEPSKSVYDAAYDHPPTFVLESSDDGQNFQPVSTIGMPLLRHLDAPGVQNFPAVKAKHFRLTTSQQTTLTSVRLQATPKLTGWPGKANFTDLLANSEEPEMDKSFVIDPATVVDVTDKVREGGRLIWQAPPGTWTILRFGHTCTGTTTVASPQGAGGLEIDKFSAEAVDRYFELYLERLIQQLRPFVSRSWKGLLIDSYEVGKQNWTALFPTYFQQKNNYAITEWMPALTGRIVQSVNSTEKFLWDLRRTQADMMAEKYYGRFKQHCTKHKLLFYAQPNGDAVFDSLQVGQHPDMPMAEFWTRYVPGTINLIKQAVSMAHGYGSRTVAAEAYTGMPETSRWTEYPYALKRQGDHMYAMGINRFVLHVFVHQPYTTGLPGMSMGAWGSHFDRNMTWQKGAREWVRYLSRSQFLLQQGLPVVAICYFKGEDPTSGIPDVNYVNPPVPKTLAGDVIGPDVLLNRIKIIDGNIVLPDGMQYRLMILAPLKKVSPTILQRLKDLVEQGMHLIVTARPVDTPGSPGNKKATGETKRLTDELWSNLDGDTVKERSVGLGKLYWNMPLEEILKERRIVHDFRFTAKNRDAAIHYTHRRFGQTEIYFISNHRRRNENIVCHFGGQQQQPEFWNAETGEITTAALYSISEEGVAASIQLPPAGSVFVLFRNGAKNSSYQAVYRNNELLFSTKSFATGAAGTQRTISDNFTISLWVKPDTPSEHPKGVVIFPPEAELVYGAGHAACGLSAGQNGIRVYEREKGPNHSARVVMVVRQSLSGWTHLALRYSNGKPVLFINGRLAGEAKSSGKIIHPGLQTPPTDELLSASFEGDSTEPELSEPLSDDAIYRLYQKGVPSPEPPLPISIMYNRKRSMTASIWQNGAYRIEGEGGTKVISTNKCRTIPVVAPWQVSFPPSSGAPSVRLEKLISLHQHPHFDVRHFSGTATYQTSVSFPDRLSNEQRVRLYLGRVENIAEVELNGKNLGVLWKEPFSIDVTKVLQAGINKLTVRVTNLWPNRMIGDAHLPAENEYDENGFIKKFPDWYLNNSPKQGRRKTFSAWNNFTKEDPLLASGLLGPVQLIVGVEKMIT